MYHDQREQANFLHHQGTQQNLFPPSLPATDAENNLPGLSSVHQIRVPSVAVRSTLETLLWQVYLRKSRSLCYHTLQQRQKPLTPARLELPIVDQRVLHLRVAR